MIWFRCRLRRQHPWHARRCSGRHSLERQRVKFGGGQVAQIGWIHAHDDPCLVGLVVWAWGSNLQGVLDGYARRQGPSMGADTNATVSFVPMRPLLARPAAKARLPWRQRAALTGRVYLRRCLAHLRMGRVTRQPARAGRHPRTHSRQPPSEAWSHRRSSTTTRHGQGYPSLPLQAEALARRGSNGVVWAWRRRGVNWTAVRLDPAFPVPVNSPGGLPPHPRHRRPRHR